MFGDIFNVNLKFDSITNSILENYIHAPKQVHRMTLTPEGYRQRIIGGVLERGLRLFLIDDQPTYGPNIRSSKRVIKSSKRHLSDPSLAVH